MPSCHHPFTARRLGCLLIGILWTAAAAGQTPTREYIYFGGRAIAIENPPPPPIVVTVSPSSATVASGSTVQFTKTVTGTTNENVTWSVVESGGGTINQSGLYTAPAVSTQSQFTIRATSQADSTTFGTATVTVNPITVTVNPPTATVGSGGTVQFTKTVTGTTNQDVTWSVVESGGGTINQSGLYTAPTVSTQSQFTIRATSQADSTKFGSATVTVNPPPPPPCVITVTPANATVQSGQELNYSAALSDCSGNSVVWEASGGSISSTGLLTAKYTAPVVSNQTDFTITAKLENDQSISGSTTVTVTPPPPPPPPCTVIIDPTSATVYSGRKQTLQATTSNCGAAGVTWTLGPGAGTLSASGLTATYTAPQGVVSTQTATVQATVTGGTATATASITIQPSQPPTLYTMSPNNSTGTRQQFSFTVSDAQGEGDISGFQTVFLSDWAYTCQISFNAEFNVLGFRLDNGTWTDVPLGAAQAPANSYCTLYAATSSVARSGNQLTLTLDLQFKPIFSGQKSVLAAASDYAGNVVGYQEVGKWLVPGTTGTSQASVIQFWTPSQVAPGQSFQVALTVRNTGQNIWQSNGLNPTQPHRLVSWDPQGNNTWGVSSIELPVQQVLPGQDVTILINATAPYSLGTQSFAWRMLYQGVEAFGQTASAWITVTSTPYPESPHPYPNSTNQTWSYYYNGSCGSLNVTFDSQTFLQSGDWLYVTDINGYAIAGSPFSGSTLAGQTVSVPGSSVFLQLVSNASGNGWGFRVTNVTCVPPPPPPGFYDDFHPEVLYASNWYHDTQFSQPKNGTISYSDTAWASVEFSFYGTGIQYYYTKAFNRGIAYVYIDGQYVGSVDQYSPTIEWQSSRMFGNLPRGYHTIRIYVSGTKQSASQWHWVDVDGFQTYQ